MIANYTSETPVARTIDAIEKMLIEIGVLAIAKEYGPRGEVAALTFGLPDKSGNLAVRLPVEINACQEALWKEYVGTDTVCGEGDKRQVRFGNKKKYAGQFRDQAERTAWRIAHDWLRIELTRLRLRQGKAAEIFMSYLWDGQRKQTLFQTWEANGGRLHLPEHV